MLWEYWVAYVCQNGLITRTEGPHVMPSPPAASDSIAFVSRAPVSVDAPGPVVSFALTPSQLERLRAFARDRAISLAQAARDAIEAGLAVSPAAEP